MRETKTGGFNRNLRLAWLDATAALCLELPNRAGGEEREARSEKRDDESSEREVIGELRRRLEEVVGKDLSGPHGVRKTIDVLVTLWFKIGEREPELHEAALALFQGATTEEDRLWLHYGLALLCYPLFRDAAATLGQMGRVQERVSPREVKRRVVAQRGALGAVEKSVERVFTSLHDWGLILREGQGRVYILRRGYLGTTNLDLEAWLLACALRAHPADEIPFLDLPRLPELFPFRFTLTLGDIRSRPHFAIQRQGQGWDMVRLFRNHGSRR